MNNAKSWTKFIKKLKKKTTYKVIKSLEDLSVDKPKKEKSERR